MICRHCQHEIVLEDGTWVAPDAGTDVEYGDGIWRETCPDNHENRIAPHEPEEHAMSEIILHTDMPLMPLTLLVGEHARVEVDTANAGTAGACFYGWGEAREGSDCPPHHLVFTGEKAFLTHMANVLSTDMGYQVVVTDYHDWSQDVVAFKYNNTHDH